MAKLPILSGSNVVKRLERAGFRIVGRKGSHVRLKNDSKNIVIVPMHREIALGTLLSIIRQSGMSRDEFLDEI